MRFIIEAKSERAEKLITSDKDIEVITKYDPIEKVSEQLERLGTALKEFKKSGVNWSVFRCYMKGKNIPFHTFDAVMGEAQDFFKSMGLL